MSITIEVDLTGAVQDYAMYSELGNAAVHGIVVAARQSDATWSQVQGWLRKLSEQEPFGEAMDTMVRECVYDALGFYNKNQYFYGA